MSLLLCTTSCKEEVSEKADVVVDEYEKYFKDILVEDYEGYNFRILTRKGMSNDQYVEEETGNIMEALCAAGSKEVVPAFYEMSLKTKFSRDTESEEMLDISEIQLYMTSAMFRVELLNPSAIILHIPTKHFLPAILRMKQVLCLNSRNSTKLTEK